MRILILCNKSPYPPKEGGPLAMNAIITGLIQAGHKVKVLAMNTNKYSVDPEEIPESYRKTTRIEFVFTDLSLRPQDAFLNLFSGQSYHVQRFFTENFQARLVQILQEESFDLVQLEMLYLTPYVEIIRKYSRARIILRSHNIEHLLWERITAITRNPLKKVYLRYLTAKLKRYELKHLNSYDGIATISRVDAEYFRQHGCHIPLADIPFGVDPGEYMTTSGKVEFPSLFNIGSMNWVPNEEGMRWFLKHAWPLIQSELPNLKLYLAGRAMPEWMLQLNQPGVHVLGEVNDAREFVRSKGIMVVPLFSGSGIRIKIIEAMALGKPVISTTTGAEGINYTPGRDLLLANTPVEFLDAVKRCVLDRELSHQLGANARKLIETEHSLSAVTGRLESFYRQVLEN